MVSIYQVDSFTDSAFSGNPAAVCVLPSPREDGWMQRVAREMNLSETAFLYQNGAGYDLRWFTPTTEVDLCGHATLASAHILWEQGYVSSQQQIVFSTKSGFLSAYKDVDWIILDFPAEPPVETQVPDFIIETLGVTPVYTGKNRLDYIVEVDTEEIVYSLNPNYSVLSAMQHRGVMVTSRSERDYDFVSRFFAPGAGIPEDPVTGSAHCCLGPYWQEKLQKSELLAYQASPRGGLVKVTVSSDRVRLGGKAVTVLTGELLH